jgi:hypothetical protein
MGPSVITHILCIARATERVWSFAHPRHEGDSEERIRPSSPAPGEQKSDLLLLDTVNSEC